MSAAVSVKPSANPSQRVLRIRHAFKVALSMTLYYWLALSLNLEQLKYGALAIALIANDTTGASLQKGLLRLVGTTVGSALGFLGLALFAQAPWLTMSFHVSWLLVVGYCMQTSKYRYAWFVAGFLPSLIWATTYGKVDTAFDYAVFRYTETAIGIVVFTMVSLLVWPRSSGGQLMQQSIGACKDLRQLFGMYRRQIHEGELSGEVGKIESQLARGTSDLLVTLQNAAADTSSVRANKAQWKVFLASLHASSDALELWRHCIDDCSDLDLDRLLSRGRSSLDGLAQRLGRIETLWSQSIHPMEQTGEDDDLLLEPLPLGLNSDLAAELSLQQRASLMNFVQQWKSLDQISCQLLQAERELLGLSPPSSIGSEASLADRDTSLRFDPMRVVSGMLPALCFVIGFFFWIFVQPPTGPSVPNMAVTFGLMVLLTPIRILNLLPSVIIVMAVLLAPTYLLLMPALSSGTELLTLIFVFCFGCGLLHGRLAGIKALGLPLFVMMTGISNQQTYSFIGLVDGSLMLIMGLGIVAVVQTLLSPSRPEQVVVTSVRAFFGGCARFIETMVPEKPSSRAKRRRRSNRYFESMVAPAPAKILSATRGLDYSLFPENTPEKVQGLIDGVRGITNRLRTLDSAQQRLASHGSAAPDSFLPISLNARDTLRRMFEGFLDHDREYDFAKQRRELRQLSIDFQQWFDDLEKATDGAPISDQVLADLYAMMGSFRGLVVTIVRTQGAISQINWRQWETLRF